MRRIFLVLTLSSLVATTQANLILNGGFEDPKMPDGGGALYHGGDSIGAWTVVGKEISLISTTYGEPNNGIPVFQAHGGFQSVDMTGLNNQGLTSGVTQSFASIVGTTYRVSFWVGRGDGLPSAYGTPSKVDLSIDGGPLAGFTNSGITPHAINWKGFTSTFVASRTTSTVTLTNGTLDNFEVGLDDVSVEAVPEPCAIVGLTLGMAAMCRKRPR